MSDPYHSSGLRVTVTDAVGLPLRSGALSSWLRGVAPARARGTVAIALVDDETIRRLNREFAGKDQATDVLSFAAEGQAKRLPPRARQPRRAPHLGDIAIATGIARRQARDAGHSYTSELRLLALHGLLHLLGYDHEADNGTMARIEARLRRKGGLGPGVIERAGTQ